MIKACMGGWCAKRSQCPNYTDADRANDEPAERLCWRGHDGFGPLCELVEDDGSRAGARFPAPNDVSVTA